MKNFLKLGLSRHIASAAIGVGMLGVLIGGNVGTAMADTGNGSLAVNAGSLSETITSVTINSGSGVTLNGTDQTPSIAMPITVLDPTGSGAGWHVTIKAGQFTGTTSNTHVLPTTAVSMSAVPFTDVTNTTDTDPSGNTVSYPLTVPNVTAASMYSAAAGSGLGAFTLNPTMTLKVPANTVPDTYTSTFTVAIVSGP
ncbi:MAG TPA: WxL domain-containing protein [Ktedonobacteraceae bacterium]|nr:WxL domain-containing protein [Ktedonobacteraceae bacterium]